jgi:hypothetical protein
MKKQTKVVVTTDKDRKGVFFGTLMSHDEDRETCVLRDARMCVYWSESTKGVLGLASHGPQKGSRITPSVPSIKLNGVTAVMECTEAAAAQWEKGLWD